MNNLDHPDMQEPQKESNINTEKIDKAPADEAANETAQSVLANDVQESKIAQKNEASVLKNDLLND